MGDTEKILVSEHLEILYPEGVEISEFISMLNQYIVKYAGKYQKLTLSQESDSCIDWNNLVLSGHREETEKEKEQRKIYEDRRKDFEYQQYLMLKEKFDK